MHCHAVFLGYGRERLELVEGRAVYVNFSSFVNTRCRIKFNLEIFFGILIWYVHFMLNVLNRNASENERGEFVKGGSVQ